MSTQQAPSDYCLLWIDHWATCMPRVEWSSWVQALGAILALAVTVAIAWQQNRDLRRTQSLHADLLVKTGIGTIEHYALLLSNLKPTDTVAIDSKFLRDAIQPFDGILSGVLPQATLAQVVATRQLMLTFANCVDDWSGKVVNSCPNFSLQLEELKHMASLVREKKWKAPK